MKEIGPQRDKIRGSRATGVLLTEDDIFAVYNTGSSEMKWERNSELRLKILLQQDLCWRRLSAQYGETEPNAIVFGVDMKQMLVLMGAGADQRHKYFVLENIYQHFYYLTSDRHGEFTLRLLSDGRTAELDDILRQDLSEARANWSMENDAMDGEEPVLFGYTCDMPRITRFCVGLQTHGLRGALYCFDFQKEVLGKICGSNVDIQCIDFERVEQIF